MLDSAPNITVLFAIVSLVIMLALVAVHWWAIELPFRIRFRLRTLFAVVTVVAVITWWIANPGRAFNATVWKNGSTERQGMADRFIARKTLIGKTRDEVIALLGEPSTDAETPGHLGLNGNLVYDMGTERGFMGMEHEWLVLELVNERVVGAEIGHGG